MPRQTWRPSADTRQTIVEEFCAKVRSSSLSQVRIAQLINELDINRNTFYYYFSNKYEVAYYAFRSDLDNRLRAAVPGSDLVYRTFDDDPFDGMAYYARTEIGARMLDHSAFIVTLVQCVDDDNELYRKLFSLGEPEFLQYVKRIWTVAFRQDLEFMLERRQIPQPLKDILIDDTVNRVTALAMYVLSHSIDIDKFCDPKQNPYQNYLLENLHQAVEHYTPADAQRTPLNPHYGSMHLSF
jgi:AcrR family transcriptional regulator